MSTSVEKAAAQVPDLVRTPALDITADDVALPRLYIGQHMSAAVQDGLVKPGAIFTALGKEDADPNVVWGPPGPKAGEGVLVHILGLSKGKSLSVDGELELYDYDDPNAPPEAWVTYNYTVALPEVDADIPYKWLLSRTGAPAAKQINLVLKKNAGRGPAWHTPFRFTTVPRENAKGKFFVPRVSQAEADASHIEIAESLAEIVATVPAAEHSRSEEPAI